MKIIKPSVEIWKQDSDMFKHIERIGRVCYKSEDKITEDSAQSFVEKLIRSRHNSVLEHGTIYLAAESEALPCEQWDNTPYFKYQPEKNPLSKYFYNKYSIVEQHNFPDSTFLYVTTNYRVLVENNWLQDLDYLAKDLRCHDRRYTARFILDRATANEFVRHREFSFTQESTRYCDYSKDKFDNQLTFIEPYWFYPAYSDEKTRKKFLKELTRIEDTYLDLLKKGLSPQQARSILPLSLKTELIMTGTLEAWHRFIKLRGSQAAHRDAYILAHKLEDVLGKAAADDYCYDYFTVK